MKKRVFSLFLALVMAVSLVPAARAAEAVTPTPPEWCPQEEYAVFPGSAAYEPENWVILEAARKEVKWGAINVAALPDRWKFTGLDTDYTVPTGETDKYGNPYVERFLDFGMLFEKALIEVRLNYSHDRYNGPYWTTLATTLEDGQDPRLEGLTDQQRYAILLWTARGILRYDGVGQELDKYLPYLMEFPQFSLEKLTDTPIFTADEQELFARRVANSWANFTAPANISILIDDLEVEMDVPPDVRDGRTMVPIRAVAEALGADVEWVQDTQQIVMTRAGVTVTMTLNSTTASIDDETVEMDVAPYATEGRTLIPARYVAEFFGQKVDWDGNRRQVLITEDKSVAGDSNLEQWAVNMGLIYGFQYFGSNYGLPAPYGKPIRFGMYDRTAKEVESTRTGLANNWGIESRDELISLVQRMTFHGHNDSFQDAATIVKAMNDKAFDDLVARSSTVDKYMWPYTREINQRWGDKGILAWDLSRMGAMVQWGYIAGYITYEEALALVEPAAQLTQEAFTNWDEFYLNYLDGYNWWARNDVYTAQEEYMAGLKMLEKNDAAGRTFPTDLPYWAGYPRANYYQYTIKKTDDTLFEIGVIGLPEAE